MIKGIDYSFSEPDFKQVKSKGYEFAISYFSKDPKKNWSKDEIQRCLKAGVAVGAVWELHAGRPKEGYDAGVQDAKDANAQKVATGYAGILYFAVDFRPVGVEISAVKEYFRGVNSILGSNIGVYGSWEVLENVKQYCNYGWQVSTWTPKKGLIHPLACIVQDANKVSEIPNTDYNYSTRDNMGLMGQSDPKPAPKGVDVTVFKTYMVRVECDDQGNGYVDVSHLQGKDPSIALAQGNGTDNKHGYPDVGLPVFLTASFDNSYVRVTVKGAKPKTGFDFKLLMGW